MPDYSLPSSVTLTFGQSSSGKTTFNLAYLLNARVVCRFIFDWKEVEFSRRLCQRSVTNERECELALASRYVCFNPIPDWGADLFGALDWFGSWAIKASQRAPGPKIFSVDELWKFTDARKEPPHSVDEIVRGIARPHGLQFLSATQHPRDYHRNIRAEVTEWICFNTVEPGDLDSVKPYFDGVEAAATLAKGEFIAYNRDSGGILHGMLEPGWPPGRFLPLNPLRPGGTRPGSLSGSPSGAPG